VITSSRAAIASGDVLLSRLLWPSPSMRGAPLLDATRQSRPKPVLSCNTIEDITVQGLLAHWGRTQNITMAALRGRPRLTGCRLLLYEARVSTDDAVAEYTHDKRLGWSSVVAFSVEHNSTAESDARRFFGPFPGFNAPMVLVGGSTPHCHSCPPLQGARLEDCPSDGSSRRPVCCTPGEA